MSTVMGLVDKKPICLTTILANQKLAKNPEYGIKLKKIVEFVGAKIAEMFLSIREDFEFRGFETAYYQCYFTEFRAKLLEAKRQRQDIILGFFVGDFPHFTSCNNIFQNYFLIPDKVMQSLPDNLKHEEVWSQVTKTNLGLLLSRMVHEIFHSLGAFHSDDGVMSGYTSLSIDSSQRLRDLKLLPLVDKKSSTIICESLSIITTLNPQRNLKYIPESNRLTYETDQSIAAAFFVHREKYTNVYRDFTYLDACKKYTELVPSEWDAFVVVHFCGHVFYYSKNDVLTTKRCTRTMVF